MIRTILTGPAVCPSHAAAPLFSPRFRVFYDKENEFTGGEPEFRQTVLDGVKDMQSKMSNLVTENGDLKTKCEAAFKDLDSQKTLTNEQAAKIVTLERSLISVSRNVDPNESTQDYLKRAFPDECKRIGELVSKGERAFNAVQRAESSSSQSVLIATQFDSAVYSRVVQYGAFRNLDVHPMGAATEQMIVETSEPDAVYVAENGTIPETALGLAPVGATAKKIATLIGISGELLQDALIDLGAYVMTKFARAVARRADYTAFLGNGTNDANNGGFTGIMNAGTVVTAASGHTTVGLMTFDELNAFTLSVGQAVLESNPVWFMNPIMLQYFMGIKDGNGRPIFLNALEAPAFGSIGTLLGWPVKLVSILGTSNAAAQPIAAFGDPMAYAVGVRLDYQFDYSDHARFTAWQRVYRALMRAAFQMKVAANIHVLKTAAS